MIMIGTGMKSAAVTLGAMVTIGLGGSSLAATPAAGPARSETNVDPGNPLAALPSKPEAHIEKLRAMGENQWLRLGKPKADPEWGVARGRSWGGRALTYAPDLRGAFFCGTGAHGYVKPDGYYMDDLWFYDLNQHRWICLYPGANTRTLKLKLDRHGFEVTEKGEQNPVSYLSHAYGNTTYNTHLRKYTIVYCHCHWWTKALPQRKKWLGLPPGSKSTKGKVNRSGKHPIFWDVAGGKWQRRLAGGSGPENDEPHLTGVAEYIPYLKKLFFTARKKVWFYDYGTNTWSTEKTSGARMVGNGCYDPKRKRIYFGTCCYDLEEKRWAPMSKEGRPEGFKASPNNGSMTYDVASGVMLWHGKAIGDHGHIAVYDPDADKWSVLKRTFPKLKTRWQVMSGFYDPVLNVHFYYLAIDSRTSGVGMLAYRYKRRPAKPAGK
jgi:hypothetical protein